MINTFYFVVYSLRSTVYTILAWSQGFFRLIVSYINNEYYIMQLAGWLCVLCIDAIVVLLYSVIPFVPYVGLTKMKMFSTKETWYKNEG